MSTRSRLFVHCTMRHLVQALQYSLFVVIRIRKIMRIIIVICVRPLNLNL